MHRRHVQGQRSHVCRLHINQKHIVAHTNLYNDVFWVRQRLTWSRDIPRRGIETIRRVANIAERERKAEGESGKEEGERLRERERRSGEKEWERERDE